MSLHELGALVAAVYFAGFGLGFVFRPEFAERFALGWNDPAGRTEVRCYYGGVSCALAAFVGYLTARGLATEALTGVLFLAVAVLVTRVVGTAVDGGWSHPYTRLAIPTEATFVIAVALVLALG